ncbi:hypothetical protein PLESTB_001741800 [Pleodorina starrii]|uniref:AB hydrolase-1 domain-containing protein n=1 Tax=Pleodorina starrii TaxID=330485 RepID=A0A9W6BZU1_9CHLO|nr:hypothetical protein PLESTB_001741800 [Pleodorina starrii]
MTIRLRRSNAESTRPHPPAAKRPGSSDPKYTRPWKLPSDLRALLLLAVLALDSFGATSLQAAAMNIAASPSNSTFAALVPALNNTVRVEGGHRRNGSSSAGSTDSTSATTAAAADAAGTSAAAGGVNNSATIDVSSFYQSADPGLYQSTDYVGPLVAGDVSPLFQSLLQLAQPSYNAPEPGIPLKVFDMAGLVEPKGYRLERHVVVTGDGYKLGTFRIPYGRAGRGPARRPPVLLIHGITLSSTCWVLNSPSESLAFILADKGFDVWMMNTRGNTFSRDHVLYRDKQSAFWRFSMDEMAQYDLPDNLNYIKRVGIIGHSQGCTIPLMMLADFPDTANSVAVLVSLAPSVYVQYMQAPLLIAIALQTNRSVVINKLHPQEYLFFSLPVQHTILNGACQTTVSSAFGPSLHITRNQYRRYWKVWPSSVSLWNVLHWTQIYSEARPKLIRFNYGPEYILENVRAPVVILAGDIDILAAKRDVAEQARRLRDGGSLRRVVHIPDYGHMDFIWDTRAAEKAYPFVVEALAESFA